MAHLRSCSLSVIGDANFLYCLISNFQEILEDPDRDESFTIELHELKEHVTNAGSARWFLQDLAAKQGTENSLVCHLRKRYPYNYVKTAFDSWWSWRVSGSLKGEK